MTAAQSLRLGAFGGPQPRTAHLRCAGARLGEVRPLANKGMQAPAAHPRTAHRTSVRGKWLPVDNSPHSNTGAENRSYRAPRTAPPPKGGNYRPAAQGSRPPVDNPTTKEQT